MDRKTCPLNQLQYHGVKIIRLPSFVDFFAGCPGVVHIVIAVIVLFVVVTFICIRRELSQMTANS